MSNESFEQEKKNNIRRQSEDSALRKTVFDFYAQSSPYKYTYNFSWLGRPIIQFPQDIIAVQEIIWSIKPDLIIETGIAHGGSAILYASLLELIGGTGQVVSIDIDIREHNRQEILKHSLSKRITMIEGSSTDPKIIEEVYKIAQGKDKVIVILDSDHTREHVLKELQLYSSLVKKDCYIVVFDTLIEDMPPEWFAANNNRWSKEDNPKMAVFDFLSENNRFIVDEEIEQKLLITVAPSGYLKCTED